MTVPDLKETLLQAALPHVAFDGWSEATFQAAVADAGVTIGAARAVCPRGAVDLALAYHAQGDAAMVGRLQAEDLSELRFRDRIASAVRFRLEAAEDKEAVRRGTVLFALPQYAVDGARAIWGTADLIWTTLGDSSDDVNWYTKRATLSAVYGATVLFWLGDDSQGSEATWAFLDRRIDDVMQFEKAKAGVRDNKVLSRLLSGPLAMLDRIKPPAAAREDMPGRWSGRR
ncbi:COQ9 family protein [Thalassovita taeanensis]|uniref:Ubiquinone biosynthesis protein COQ9 n=1 Tax=Thalassovita taeanensis TaxID=657014 RepID=A0A1H9IFB6_9RHOB|nr:COQ9 family protein [Thalassovita taeanensis]SEQ73208.1 ubiquinone biosynthesis protein COQ9 [Thalassovita taeanensis]